MSTLADAFVDRFAASCINNMGDVFGDFEESRDAPSGFKKPHQIATESVAETLQVFAATFTTNSIYSNAIRMEYRELALRLGRRTSDPEIVDSLVSEAAWTEEGARAVLLLAKNYGTSILRNALALAEALDIEDGETGL